MKKSVDVKDRYFMDDPREAERLERKVNATEFIEKYVKRHIDHLREANILEAGCGPGVFLQKLANLYADHNITGIDISEHRIGEANKKLAGVKNARAIKADIYQLPFPDNYFDFIFSRFLFEYLRYPVAAAKELLRVCKPDGKILLQDLDNQFTFYPELSPLLTNALQALQEHTGFDPDIGRKLFSIGRNAGLECINIENEMYHKIFGRIDDFNYKLWDLKLDIAFNNTKFIPVDNAQKLKTEMLQSLQDEKTIMFSNLFTLTYKKPA
jgi:ubiquinone/menaquinone biosynthesis C-methylase UbiE